jgi:hypothetical protein
MMKELRKGNNSLLILITMLLFIVSGCQNLDKSRLVNSSFEYTLINEESNIQSSYCIDSISYTYVKLKNSNSLYVNRRVYKDDKQHCMYYYLKKMSDGIYIGTPKYNSGDTIFYQKYLSKQINETCIFDLAINMYGYLKYTPQCSGNDTSSLFVYTGQDIELTSSNDYFCFFNDWGVLKKVKTDSCLLISNEPKHIVTFKPDFIYPIENPIETIIPSSKYFRAIDY